LKQRRLLFLFFFFRGATRDESWQRQLKQRCHLFLFLFHCRRGATREKGGSASGNSLVFFIYSCSFVGVVLQEKKIGSAS
jgi:hypothetical protein